MGQNPKIGQLWCPVVPQPYVIHKSWSDLRNSLALGLQRGVNSISLQCIPWPIACSEWCAYLGYTLRMKTLFRGWPVTSYGSWHAYEVPVWPISDFGDKWPRKWKVSKRSFRIPRWDSKIHFVTKFGENRPLRSCWRSRGLQNKTKTLALRGTRPSPHFIQNGLIALKVPWTLSPRDMSTYTEFGTYRLRFAGLIPERSILRPKNLIQYSFSAYNKDARLKHTTVNQTTKQIRCVDLQTLISRPVFMVPSST